MINQYLTNLNVFSFNMSKNLLNAAV